MSTKNHYETLQLSKDATADQIKEAYRRLAREYHPDKNPNHNDEFKEISKAYQILSDPQKRREFDATQARRNNPYAHFRPFRASGTGFNNVFTAYFDVFDHILNIFSTMNPHNVNTYTFGASRQRGGAFNFADFNLGNLYNGPDGMRRGFGRQQGPTSTSRAAPSDANAPGHGRPQGSTSTSVPKPASTAPGTAHGTSQNGKKRKSRWEEPSSTKKSTNEPPEKFVRNLRHFMNPDQQGYKKPGTFRQTKMEEHVDPSINVSFSWTTTTDEPLDKPTRVRLWPKDDHKGREEEKKKDIHEAKAEKARKAQEKLTSLFKTAEENRKTMEERAKAKVPKNFVPRSHLLKHDASVNPSSSTFHHASATATKLGQAQTQAPSRKNRWDLKPDGPSGSTSSVSSSNGSQEPEVIILDDDDDEMMRKSSNGTSSCENEGTYKGKGLYSDDDEDEDMNDEPEVITLDESRDTIMLD